MSAAAATATSAAARQGQKLYVIFNLDKKKKMKKMNIVRDLFRFFRFQQRKDKNCSYLPVFTAREWMLSPQLCSGKSQSRLVNVELEDAPVFFVLCTFNSFFVIALIHVLTLRK